MYTRRGMNYTHNSKHSSNIGFNVRFWTLVCCSAQWANTLRGKSSMMTKGSLNPLGSRGMTSRAFRTSTQSESWFRYARTDRTPYSTTSVLIWFWWQRKERNSTAERAREKRKSAKRIGIERVFASISKTVLSDSQLFTKKSDYLQSLLIVSVDEERGVSFVVLQPLFNVQECFAP